MDSLLSFSVGLLHPLQHAGLSGALRVADHPGDIANFIKTFIAASGPIPSPRGVDTSKRRMSND